MAESAVSRAKRRELGRTLVHHKLPLTPDGSRTAELLLPHDLTPDEAERFAAFVAAVALPEHG